MIELKGISKTYTVGEQSTTVLSDVSLTIQDGEFVAIMGPSGSGKSTLMNIIGMLDIPSTGTYQLDELDVSALSQSEQAHIRGRKIGFVFQSYNLLPRMSALKQVMLPLGYHGVGRKEREKRALAALQMVGLSEKIASKPNQLSGGQQQRIAVARALVVNPSIILADEPTGALDSKSGAELMQILKQLNDQGKTIVLITHEQRIADFAKRTLRLLDGKLEKLN